MTNKCNNPLKMQVFKKNLSTFTKNAKVDNVFSVNAAPKKFLRDNR